jgi:hypothetical protein
VEFIKSKQTEKEQKSEFKLKRFQNVDPRTNTNRNAKAAGSEENQQ